MPETRAPVLTDNPAVQNAADPGYYVEITVSVPAALASWRHSLFSYEWLDPDGKIKAPEKLKRGEREKREIVEKALTAGRPIMKPVLGIGLLDNVEIGSGRAEFLTLAAHGVQSIPVHIPKTSQAEFKPFMIRGKERGNVLFYILIAVAMLAALSFAVSQSGRGSIQQLSEDKIKLYASEVLSYASTVGSAVSQLRLRGCADTEISFENNIMAGYDNAGAPSDNTCHIFDTPGGAVHWKTISSEMLADHAALSALKGDVEFTGNIAITDVGTDAAELLMQIDLLNKDVCMKINDMVNVTNGVSDPPADDISTAQDLFDGDYNDSTPQIIGDDAAVFAQKTAGCRRIADTGEDAYFFYKVLLAR